jgi:glycosyltransferase involved in cell wall biosynthesis
LVRGARAVLFASLYEGFGLPVLEAMQLGTPVLTSTTSSLPEVAGNAALIVDPYSPSAIAEGLRCLESDRALCERLSAAGLRQAEGFSRARYADRLTALYQAVLATPRR